MSKTDAGLVEAARRGDDGARDELVKRYQRQAVLLAGALVNDVAEAEDLGQEAFVRAFRNLDLLVDPSRFGPWLRRIVFGVSIDWLRSFRPDLYRGWDGVEEQIVADTTPSPLDHLLRGEMAARVAAALAALPPRYRVPIRLFHLDGLSHSKIADTLGLPIGTVRSLVARARRKLAPLLAEYAPDAVVQVDELFEEQHVRPTSSTSSTSTSSASSASRRFFHVANGHSTTGTIHEAGIPGASSIWADPLHEGPVPGGLSDEELLKVRARYLAHTSDGDRDASPTPSYEDVVVELTAWRAALDHDESYDELVLWFEHDLFDQLNLVHLLDRIGRTLPTVGVAGAAAEAARPVSLICIGSFPGRPRFKGLGELTPDELASLLETRQRVSAAQYALAERAWRAFRAPDPREIEALLETDTSALPFLAAALRRHLEEFPSAVDGLSRSERRLLELARPEAIDIHAAFRRMHDDETAFYVADSSFWQIARDLASATPPLITLAIDRAAQPGAPGHLPRGTISLTDTGRAVLQGTTDRVTRCGLHRWLGGVHLESPTAIWRWDTTAARIIPPH